MGSFLTNLHVRLGDRSAVIKGLRKAKGLPACVSPVKNGWVSVFPKATESQDQNVLEKLTTEVARHVPAPVISFLIHDSDIFRFVLRDGDLRDDYDSEPGYWDDPNRPPAGGNVMLLMQYLPKSVSAKKLKIVLHKKRIDGKEVMAEDMLYWIGKRLGIEGDLLANSWDYLKGKLPWGLTRVAR